jgi:hypothetical protein
MIISREYHSRKCIGENKLQNEDKIRNTEVIMLQHIWGTDNGPSQVKCNIV